MPNLRRLLPPFLAIALTLLSIPLVAGYWGALHPAFDSLAHFRQHFAMALALLGAWLLLFSGWRQIGAAGLVLGVAAIAAVHAPTWSAGPARAAAAAAPQARYRLLQMNLRFDNATPKKVFSLIGAVRPDVITLNEVSRMWVGELKYLKAVYPYHVICPPPARIGGVAILSRRPFSETAGPRCYDRGSMAVASVNFGGTEIDIAALHLGWPWPFEQHDQVERVVPALHRLSPTAILAGDLNAAPWSATARRLAEAGRLTTLGGIGPTWFLPEVPEAIRRIVGLPIDNIFTKGRVVPLSVERRSEAGSDHLPVLFEFGLELAPQPDEDDVMQARAGAQPPA